MNKKLFSKKGISLIVLVITIIVMIILATAIILSIRGSDVKGKAEEAVNKNDLAAAKEFLALARADWEMDYDRLKKKYDGFKDYAEEKLQKAGFNAGNDAGQISVSEKGLLYEYKVPVIPDGFIASDIDSEDEVSEGLVIYEGTEKVSQDEDAKTTRNQFVWVPVPNLAEFKTVDGYDWENDVMQTCILDGTFVEPNPNFSATYDPTGEYAEYHAMKKSIEKYGGFYIARYESGKETINGVDKVVSKKGINVWGKIPWGVSPTEIGTEGAVYQARNMYNSNSVSSHLIYGIEWDSVMRFMSDVKNPYGTKRDLYIYDPIGMNRYGSDTTVDAGTDLLDSNGNILNKVKNIYDIAGNYGEWTMETNGKSLSKVARTHWLLQYYSPTFRIGDSCTTNDSFNTFRVALYLK